MPQQPRPKDYPLQPQPPDQSKALQLLASHSLHPDFAARFEVTSELGSGGFGFVLGAIDHLTGREVAVKFIMRSRVPDTAWVKDQDLGAIPLEVFFLRHCNHKNIISFVAVYTDSTYVYLVTELHGSQWTAAKDHIGAASQVPVQDPTQMLGLSEKATAATSGYYCVALRCAVPPPLTRSNTCPLPAKLCRRPSMDLFECIEQFDRIPEDVAKFIFRQVAEAIRYLHSKSVVHRDIKDENIVIDNNFHVKIIDFGSAAIEHPDPGFLFDRFQGTIQYASPEILRGEKYRGRPSDIWAMGVLLYTILYGEVPFASSEQAKNYNFKPPRLPSSPECMNLLNWMLQKHASKRPTSEQVLRHPWMAIAPAITRTTTTVGNMCIS
ncbi:kinase-like domain-containing protein [Entophlyctis helioformis]|nr:kinase-like domain-containing protein [Entophlyctis helioformis]